MNPQGYFPIVFFNDYWNLNKDYWVLNDTVTEFNMTLTFNHLSMFKWQMYAAQSVKNKWMMGALSEAVGDESDEDQVIVGNGRVGEEWMIRALSDESNEDQVK